MPNFESGPAENRHSKSVATLFYCLTLKTQYLVKNPSVVKDFVQSLREKIVET
jgi:hypothetical protein